MTVTSVFYRLVSGCSIGGNAIPALFEFQAIKIKHDIKYPEKVAAYLHHLLLPSFYQRDLYRDIFYYYLIYLPCHFKFVCESL